VSIKSRDLAKIRESLIERRGQIEAQLHILSTEKVSDDQVQDPGDEALSSTMENLRNSLQDTELMEYKRLLQAIEKIDDGTYGICVDCDGEISEKRLNFYPNAARCLACQETFEDRSS
jgi:DnaK suppressor protein